ncbi:unnamed protein product [Rotaria sordida]|uniref:Uncharacterized protein n=1 Tax=Rotaria sordida TaxID=392033 RepID=A0A815F917_9BILA|nr:unnamed protein product [Rotaria sordida]CAF1321856.1 unnamed protein product [Rotaria sordida]
MINFNQSLFQLVIDIDRSVASVSGNGVHHSNKVVPEPTSFFVRQDNYALSPYSGQSAVFSPQCNAPQQDLTAKCCSSCGNSFNKY